jgi:tRNA-2-methylthio-N6-dimethylallyladenosine synthase
VTPKRYLVRTFGCQMNEHDSERIAGVLSEAGMEPASDLDDADVVVLNTCCIRENADNKLYGNLGQLKTLRASRPHLQIAVGGCLAQKDRELIRTRAPHVDAVFGTFNVRRVAELLRQAEDEGPVTEVLDEAPPDEDLFPSALPVRRNVGYAGWVTIQIGCDNSCAFCIVPAVRGPEVSRPFGDVVAEVGSLARSGTVEVTLLGQNVNSYGRDLALSLRAGDRSDEARHIAGAVWADDPSRSARPLFGDLLRAVGSVPGIRRVRFTSPHPKDLRPETIAAMAETRTVCEHLHLPLQAGSDRVLREMRRGYTATRYLERLWAARAAVPDLAVTTDLIVGFPGETEEDFERTLEVVAEAAYDSAYTFVFSPRPGTRAAAREDVFVPPEVCAERFERLKVVVERSALARHRARIGRVEEVLVEGPSKKDSSLLTGRTRQNKLVHFRPEGVRHAEVDVHEATSSARPLRSGAFALVRVTDAAPHHLMGELVEVTHRPRLRVPVQAG